MVLTRLSMIFMVRFSWLRQHYSITLGAFHYVAVPSRRSSTASANIVRSIGLYRRWNLSSRSQTFTNVCSAARCTCQAATSLDLGWAYAVSEPLARSTHTAEYSTAPYDEPPKADGSTFSFITCLNNAFDVRKQSSYAQCAQTSLYEISLATNVRNITAHIFPMEFPIEAPFQW
jgi:hypothetical protein